MSIVLDGADPLRSGSAAHILAKIRVDNKSLYKQFKRSKNLLYIHRFSLKMTQGG